MDTRQAGHLGALATNKKLTHEQRSKAAKKAWRNRRRKVKSLSPATHTAST